MDFVFDRAVAGEPQFAGRAVLLRTLQTNVPGGRSYGLLGGPKTGRTSVLKHLGALSQQILRRSRQQATKIVPVYVDLEALSARPQIVAHAIWEALCAAVLDPYVQGHPDVPRPNKVELLRSSAPWELLTQATADLWAALANTPGWCRYTLLLDNAHALASADYNSMHGPLTQFIKDRAAHHPAGVVLAGDAKLVPLLTRPGTHWSFVRPQILGVLREAEIQALLRQMQTSVSAEVQECVRLSGGHPYVLQCLLAAGAADVDLAVDAALPHLEPLFASLWQSFPRSLRPDEEPLEQRLMVYLAEHQGEEVSQQQLEAAAANVSTKAAVDFLEMNAIAERTVRGNTSCIRAPCLLWNDFFTQQVVGVA